MAWTATETFESYSNGDNLNTKNGGSGWNGAFAVGAGTWTASSLQAQAGTISGRDSSGNVSSYINRAVTAITVGSIQYYIRASATGLSEYINLSSGTPASGANSKVLGGFEANNIVFYDNGTQRTILSSYSANTWYKITIVFDGGANTYTVQVDSGTVFGPYAYSFGGSGDISNVQFYRGGGTPDFFIDSIAPVSSGTLYTQTITETVSLTATVIKTTTRILAETLTATASLIRTASRTISETITATASLIKTSTRTLSETITATASVIKTPTKLLIESGASTSNGPLNPATTADDATVGTRTWNNPNNAQASDATYSDTGSILSPSTTHYLKATNFGLSIPSTATVTGILVEIQKKRTSGGVAAHIEDSAVKIVKSDGSIGTTNKADTVTNWPTTEAYASYGSSSDLWGETWAYSDINNSNFGAVISAAMPTSPDGNTASIDHIRITVYYTAAGMSLTDTFVSAVTSGQTFTEAITLTATFLVTTTRTLSETITTVATFIKSINRTLIETITNTDTFAFLRSAGATLSETISLTVSFLRSIGRTFTGTLTTTDTFEGYKATLSTLSEAITATDTLIKTTTKVLTETIATAASYLQFSGRILTETITTTGTLVATRMYSRQLLDAIIATDTFSRVIAFARTFSEVVTVTDTIRKLRNGLETIWRNVTRGAAATLSNVAKAVTNWSQNTKPSTSWDNEERS